jgi:outer membrane receptor protein involved in Fe transport
VNSSFGYTFLDQESVFSGLKMQLDITNILNDRYPITIANPFNGTQYAAGRQFFLSVQKSF